MISATVSHRSAYVAQTLMRLSCSVSLLVDAFVAVVKRHEILRTTFVTTASGIFQVIWSSVSDLVVSTVSTTSLAAFMQLDSARGFAVGDMYFVRLTIVETSDADGSFAVLTMHHALYDGWSHAMTLGDMSDVLCGRSLLDRPSFRRVVDYIEAPMPRRRIGRRTCRA
jgi:hypothetical protein